MHILYTSSYIFFHGADFTVVILHTQKFTKSLILQAICFRCFSEEIIFRLEYELHLFLFNEEIF
jgi:hypothetical protein